jgi:hypothetical protein
LAPWFEERKPTWESYDFVPLADREGLAALVAEWIARRPAGGPPVEEAALQRDVVAFLWSQSAPDGDEYMSRIAKYRRLRAAPDIGSDKYIHATYHELTGSTLPLRPDPRALLAKFWRSHPDAFGRPAAVSRTAYLEVALTKPLATVPPDSTGDLFRLTRPDFVVTRTDDYVARWEGPVVTVFIPLTQPTTTFAQVLERHDTTPVCILGCVLRTTDAALGIIHCILYFCPDEAVWQVLGVRKHYAGYTFWPV